MNNASENLAWRAIWRQLVLRVGSQAGILRRSVLALMLAALTQGVAFACLYPTIDALLKSDLAQLRDWGLIFSAATVLTLALRWYGQGFEYRGHLAQATHELRLILGVQLRKVPLAHLQRSRAGEMNGLLLGSVDENLNYAIAIINILFLAIITPLTASLITVWIDWRLGLLMLLIFPLLVPFYYWRRPAMRRQMQTLGAAHQRLNGDIVEFAQGMSVLRSCGNDSDKSQALQAHFEELERFQTLAHRQGAGATMFIASIVELGLQAVVLCAAVWVVSGTLNLAFLIAAAAMIMRFAEPMAMFISYTALVELIASALKRIEAFMAIKPLPVRASAALPERYDITFDNVSYGYDSAKGNTLDGVSLTFPVNKMSALVGSSGAGKTTITKLLMRYADPQQGEIRIGGVDIRDLTSRQLNSLISVVFQDVWLFNDTLLANMLIARPDATLQEVEDAARDAQCFDFISRLPQGWQTPMGEMGGQLSGGERQRISIARALLKNAPIVILDEPTAALDIESELAVQKAIDRLVADRTVIIIAHRLSTIAGADNIVVMEQGRVVEQGTHAQLLAREERYSTLWRLQMEARVWRVDDAPAE